MYIWQILKIIKSRLIFLFLSVLFDNTKAYGLYSYGSENGKYWKWNSNATKKYLIKSSTYNIVVNYQDLYDQPDPTERYDMPSAKSKEQDFDKRVLINRTRPERCDKIITLYQLMHYKDKDKSVYSLPMSADCARPFIVTTIPNSNMILLVTNSLCAPRDAVTFNNQPVEKHYHNSSSLPCYKHKNQSLYRRQLKYCFNRHHNESGIELCGLANSINYGIYLVIPALVLLYSHFIQWASFLIQIVCIK